MSNVVFQTKEQVEGLRGRFVLTKDGDTVHVPVDSEIKEYQKLFVVQIRDGFLFANKSNTNSESFRDIVAA